MTAAAACPHFNSVHSVHICFTLQKQKKQIFLILHITLLFQNLRTDAQVSCSCLICAFAI